MSTRSISRRDLLIGTGAVITASALPQAAAAAAGAQDAIGAAQNSGSGENGAGEQKPNLGTGRAAWMQDPRYCWGVMTHYLADWQARAHHLDMSVAQWNKLVDGFDVDGMARRRLWRLGHVGRSRRAGWNHPRPISAAT